MLARASLVVLVLASLAALAAAQGKCAGPSTCSSCVKVSGCGWCGSPTSQSVAGPNGTTVTVTAPIGCVAGSFSKGPGCGATAWRSTQCVVSNMYIILSGVGAGLVCVTVLCCWVWCVCRARNKRKTRKLLDDHDAWVSNLHASTAAAGTPKTDARRAEMAAKYGRKDPQGTPLLTV